MRAYDQGSEVRVTVSREEVSAFKSSWPCSGLATRSIGFLFDKRNGDLVDVWGQGKKNDGAAMLALSHDASNFAAKKLGLPQLARPNNDCETQTCHACGVCDVCWRSMCDQDCEPDRPDGMNHYRKPIGSIRCRGEKPDAREI